MNLLKLFFILFFATFCVCDDSNQDRGLFSGYLLRKLLEAVPDLKEKWTAFKQSMGLEFASPAEEKDRLYLYGKSAAFVDELRKSNISYEVELNGMAHLTRQEYFKLLGLNAKVEETENVSETQEAYARAPGPPSIDWRKKGVVPPVKDQGKICGSCYSFTAITTVETRLAIKTGKIVLFSEQSAVDCSRNYGNNGCKGGLHMSVYRYWMSNGLTESAKYPYQQREGTCKPSTNKPVVKNFVMIKSKDELSLKQALYNTGPIGIGMDARWDSFKYYKGEIYNEPKCSQTMLNHAMTIVAWENTATPHYIVRNSWGTNWGIAGHWRVKSDVNMCGIAELAAYPVLA